MLELSLIWVGEGGRAQSGLLARIETASQIILIFFIALSLSLSRVSESAQSGLLARIEDRECTKWLVRMFTK